MENNTIVGISTPMGSGAIGIIRLSGSKSIEVVNKIFKGANLLNVSSHTINYGHIFKNDVLVDEVLVNIMRSPRTFTKEDVVEINCHGGSFVMNEILALILKDDVNLAEPGEFTKRAFLNGRIDLTKAEAVMDIIEAKTNNSLSNAINTLSGKLFKLIQALRDDVLNIIADVEVNIDYPEYDEVSDISSNVMKPKLLNLHSKLSIILENSKYGKLIKDGLNVAIIGRPNVGKSSLLNMLIEEEKAIVTNIAGTTRDTVEGSINLGGVILNIIDTAGIRKTSDIVEKIGVDKSINLINQADIILLILNNSEELTNQDKELLDLTHDKKRIVIVNKSDLEDKLNYNDSHIKLSALKNDGINFLESEIMKVIGFVNQKDATYVSNTRHIAILNKCFDLLNEVLNGIDIGVEIDLLNIDLHKIFNLLGDIIGINASDSLLDELFSKFCLGK